MMSLKPNIPYHFGELKETNLANILPGVQGYMFCYLNVYKQKSTRIFTQLIYTELFQLCF